MKKGSFGRLAMVMVFGLSAQPVPGGEIIEEIVAWVNGDIITRSELEREEQILLAEVYRRFTGAELDEQARKAKAELLDRMIDQKILLQKASRLYDMSKMGDGLLESFKEQQKITTDEDLSRLLKQEGMTVEGLKRRLVDMYAPEQVIRFEVVGRISVSDKEVEAYYADHPEAAEIPAEATLREIILLADSEPKKEERRAEAGKVRERAAAPGADFAEVAKEVSEAGTRDGGGLLGKVGKGDLSPQLEQVAFTLPVGEVSPVLETPYGFHLLKVDARTDATRKPLEEIKEQLRTKIENQKYDESLQAFLKKARAESEIRVKEQYQGRLAPGSDGS